MLLLLYGGTKMSIGKQIKRRRIELGYSQDDLAKKLGYSSRSSINKIELGKTDIPQSRVLEFANALQTTPGYLLDWEDHIDPTITVEQAKEWNTDIAVPLYGKISTIYPYLYDNNIKEYIPLSGYLLPTDKEYFAIHTDEEKLIGRRLRYGDLVILEQDGKPENGDYGLFCVSGIGLIFCKYKERDKLTLLQPINPKYDAMVFTENEKGDYAILGKYVLSIIYPE